LVKRFVSLQCNYKMMAKKKKVTSMDIISWFMEYVEEKEKYPSSVADFAKDNNFDESLFYEYFDSFQEVKSAIFRVFFENTNAVLEQSEDYLNFNTRNKLLTFYYTFFENLSANRSYVVFAIGCKKCQLSSFKTLHELRTSFINYIGSLGIETIDFKEPKLEKIQQKAIQESAWIQLLVTMKFWLDDSSSDFEKTDIFIEKSIKASFDLIDTTAIKSILDFGKFIFKEKFQKNS